MKTQAIRTELSRWRALLDLLWRAGPRHVLGLAALVLATGLLPTALILATGALVAAVPAAVEHGLTGPGGAPALWALAATVGGLGALAIGTNVMGYLARALNNRYALEVHTTIARVTLGTRGVAPLEDPAFSDELNAIQDADRRGMLRRTVGELCMVTSTRLRGLGGFVVLAAFVWWAPLVLAVAWQLTNQVFLRSTRKGVTVEMTEGAVRMRRAEYLRSVALEPAAAKEVRIFGLGPWAVDAYARAWMDALTVIWRNRAASRWLTAAASLALLVSHGVVLGALGLAAGRGAVDVAALFVFVQAAFAIADLGIIGDAQWWVSRALALAERVVALRERMGGEFPDAPAPQPVPARQEVAVRLSGVRFTYRGRETPTLDGMELEIPAGQSLAIVGENGAGKSTLIKLLCGLYEPDAGSVTLDGVPAAEARRRVGVIFQDFVRYGLPLRENVAFGHLALLQDQAALESVLRDAGAGELLERLPRGWDTVLARGFEGGVDLSGGQWQRLALARALAAVRGGAGLLILDEPTAALDVRAETELFRRFLELTKSVTTILVSHRLSSVRHADRIVVVHGGRVVEDGSHDELMTLGGRYAHMFLLQAERFAEAQPVDGEAEREVVDA
jgi:ATP-binding cassette subfamily B protein